MKTGISSTARDMILSLGCAFGLIAIIAVFTFRPGDTTPVSVEWQPTLQAARDTGPFDPAAPPNLPAGWRSNNVRWVPLVSDPNIATWHVGFITPDDQYVAVDQSNANDRDFIKRSTAAGKIDGTQDGGAKEWTRYFSEDTGHRSLVTKLGDVTTVVTGTFQYDALATFAESLRSQ